MTPSFRSLRSLRVLSRLLLAVVLVTLALGAISTFRPASEADAADPMVACYHRTNYTVRLVNSASQCTRLEIDVLLTNNQHPIWLCAASGSPVLKFAGGNTSPVTSRCGVGGTYLRVPGDTATNLCVTTATGALSLPPCGSGQTPLVVPPRNTPPVAQATSASLLEDSGSVTVNLSATDADGDNLTFTIVQGPQNGSLGSITPTGCSGTIPKTCTATVQYTPNQDHFGTDSFTYRANDALGSSAPATATITITGVNDEPGFTSGGNVTVNEDSGAYNQAWATNVHAGPANESGQTHAFNITGNSNSTLFSSGPSVSSTGVLSFNPAPDANGDAEITLKVMDNGGTANGGDDESPTQTFTITVRSVNDRPTFSIGGNQTVAEDAGPQSVSNFASNFDPGPPDESAQTVLDYKVSTDEDELFSVQPDISNGGTLTYTPAGNASGVATIRVRVQDDGGTANGGEDTSGPDSLTFTITISAVNDPPEITVGDDTVSTLEDTELVFSSSNSNLISIDDVDAGSSSIQVTLTVTNGTLTLDSDTGLTFTPPGPTNNGVNDTTMTFTGSLDNINAALSGMSYQPNADANDSDTLSITVNDQGNTGSGGAGTDSASVAITVIPVNDEPSFTPGGNVTVNEDSGPYSAGWATTISKGAANENGQTLTFTVTNDDNDLFSAQPDVDETTGTLTFTPAPNANGSATVSVTLSDNGGTANNGDDTSATQTFTITVTAVNDEPTFTKGGNQTVGEDAGPQIVNPWATGLSKGPADESGQTLTFVVTDNTNEDLFSAGPAVSSTGVLTYTPAPNANGSATITLKVTDNGGTANGGDDESATQTFTITVTAVNDEPSFTKGGNQTVGEDAGPQTVNPWATGLSTGPSDESGQTLTFVVTDNTNEDLFSAGPAVSSTGVLTYTPATNANGSATITLKVTDDGGTANGGDDESATQTFTITVTPVNDPPSFTSGGDVSIPPDTTVYSAPWATNISPGPSDESGQTVQFVITGNTNEDLFTVQPTISATGVLSFTAVEDAEGSADITVVLRDNGASSPVPNDNESDPVTFTIATNQPPTISDVTDLTINEDESTNPAITITITDPDGAVANATMSATSTNTTLLPEPASYVFGGSNGSRTLVITPAADQNGSATVTITVTDEEGGIASDTFLLTVTPVNDEPTFTLGGNQTVAEDSGNQTISGFATAISTGPADESGQTVTFTVTNDNNSLFSTQPNIDEISGNLTYTPAPNAFGSTTVTVTLTDSGSNTAPNDNTSTQTFTITVTAVNDPPSFTTGGNVTVGEDSGAYSQAWATGINQGPGESGQTLGFVVTGNTNPGLFSSGPTISSTGVLSFTPTTNANGSSTITVHLEDDGSSTPPNDNTGDDVTFAITVTAVNDKPVLTGLESTTITYTENDDPVQLTNAIDVSDVDGTTLTGATVTIGSFVSGQDVLAFTAQPGIVGNFSASTGVLTFTASPAVPHADFETVLRSVTYQNTSDDPTAGNRVISFQVNDGEATNNLSDAVTRTINVVPVNDPPTFTNDPYTFSVNENSVATTAVGTVTSTDAEAAQTHTYAITAGNTNNAFQINSSTGAITVQTQSELNFEVTPSYTLTVTVTDNGTPTNLSDTATVTINITDVNEAPTAATDSYSAFGNTQLRVAGPTSPASAVAFTTDSTNPLTNDTDPDTNPAFNQLSIVAGSLTCIKGATATIQTTGPFTFLPGPGQNNADAPAGNTTCTYQLTDGTNTVNGTISVAITNMIWYVRNDTGVTPDTGTSVAPFDLLSDAGSASAASEIIYVLTGDGTNTGQNAGITLKNGQKLWGQGVALVVDSTTLINAGARPVVGNAAGNGVSVTDLTGVEIRGLSLSGSDNAIDVTSSGANSASVTIDTNIITAATNEGIDVNGGGSGGTTLSIHDNTLTATGTALDITRSAGTVTITAFDDNVVTGNSGSTGISVNTATFDATPGGTFQTVSGGNTSVGAAGNGVGTSGVVLSNVQGDLSFTDLDIYADNGFGLQAAGLAQYNGSAGMQIVVTGSGSVIESTGNAALHFTVITTTLPLSSLKTTNSAGSGIHLNQALGTVTAGSGSAITNTNLADVAINAGTATFTYNGTITDDTGQLVSITNTTGGVKTFTGAITDGDDGDGSGVSLTGNSGATIRFSGGLVLSTGSNPAFTATGGGTVEVCDENPCNPGATGANINKITTTTATALNVTSTTIGSNKLEFRSIAAGTGASGPTNGIVLNSTGSSGGLTVAGTGGAGSGGTIQRTTGDGISLNSTANVNLNDMIIQNGLGDGIHGVSVSGFSLDNSTITNYGDSTSDDGLQLGEASGSVVGATGVVSITNSSISGNAHNNFWLRNTSGTISSFTVTNSSFNDFNGGDANAANAFLFEASGTSTVTQASMTGNTFSNNTPQRALEVQAHDTATISDFVVSGNKFANNGIHASFTQDTASNLEFVFQNNGGLTAGSSITGTVLQMVNVFSSSQSTGGTIVGTISGNKMDTGAINASGISVVIQGRTDATLLIDSNVVTNASGARGISVAFRGPTTAVGPVVTNDVTITNNNVNNALGGAGTFPAASISLEADNQSGSDSFAPVVRADIRGNTVPGAGTCAEFGTGCLQYYEYDATNGHGTGQLVDTGAPSASANAQLAETNTGSVFANAGVALIPGPINTP